MNDIQIIKELPKLNEATLKQKIRELYFENFKCEFESNKIDFCIWQDYGLLKSVVNQNLFWAEAKQKESDLEQSLTQLIITIAKYKKRESHRPRYIGAFDAYKMIFLPFDSEIEEILNQNAMNWNVTPSDKTSETFVYLYKQIKDKQLLSKAYPFEYSKDTGELRAFIKKNLNSNVITKEKINKDNFVRVYHKWLKYVKESIAVNWEMAKNSMLKWEISIWPIY